MRWIQGHRGARKEKHPCQFFLKKLLKDLDGIWYRVQSHWSWLISYSLKKRTILRQFYRLEKTLTLFMFGHLQIGFFQTWCEDRHQCRMTLTFIQDHGCMRKQTFALLMSITWIDLCNELCLSNHLHGQNVWLYNANFLTNFFFMFAMLIGTIDFYHFIPLSLTLTLPGSQGQHEAKAVGLIFLCTFHQIRIKFDIVMNETKLDIMRLPSSKIYWNKGNNC